VTEPYQEEVTIKLTKCMEVFWVFQSTAIRLIWNQLRGDCTVGDLGSGFLMVAMFSPPMIMADMLMLHVNT
jgi:hypothetical protein